MINTDFKIRTKFSIDSYLEFTSVLMVFMQGFVITGLPIIDLKLYYLFLITNSLMIYLKYGVKLNKYLFLFLGFALVHGFITYVLFGTPLIYLIKQFIGISFAAVYFNNVFIVYDINKLFKIYLKLTIIFCVIAIIFYPTGLLDKETNRMDGLMSEPSKFIIVNIPALYYFLKQKKYRNAFILFLGIILAKSSLGYIGVLIILLFLFLRKETLKYLGFTIIPFFIVIPFLQNNDHFQSRLNSTLENLEVFQTQTFSRQVNISTYALLKNGYVAVNNFGDYIIGTGLGSFGYRHDYYIKELNIPDFIYIIGMDDLNREDANSLFLRVLSDFGLFGLFFIIIFLFLGLKAHFTNYSSEKKAICTGFFIYFLLKLIRMGHYFPEEMFFFLFMFFFMLPKFKIKRIS
ncbi:MULTISPECIES: hypothetical protein [Algibacter]|uniref:Oligosaccharide repeat unit polymerase Wzy n=2 Tax=Algibacter TaxID=261827 RepID=A0A4R8M9Y3_9FLAO|nr:MULTISPECIES: hypothetical protein [Algibacter]MDN3664916.1 hypothetical protein [Algibacter miyuki]MWW24430.1 hypothetical protein [Algibacter lectus]TDY62449.1 hypothetical protein DFQ06_2289 [Algibacter lectus]